jgi:hypothetical protein
VDAFFFDSLLFWSEKEPLGVQAEPDDMDELMGNNI